jgi:enoyl-CoA hydratase/carnithine racemase
VDEQLVLLEIRGAVGLLTLNRPQKLNAMTRAMGVAFNEAVETVEEDDSVQCLVITGAGDRAFCAGADMAERVELGEVGGRSDGMAEAFRRLGRFSKPTIAAINGYAYGGGAMLAAICDIRIASHTARFRFPGADYGLVVGGAWLPRLIASPVAKDLVFTAKAIDSREALRIGLINQIEIQSEVMDSALAMAERIADKDTNALRASKAVIDAATYSEAAQSLESESNQRLRSSDEHRDRFREAAGRITTRR